MLISYDTSLAWPSFFLFSFSIVIIFVNPQAALEGLLETAPLSSSSTTTASSSTSLPATATPTPATAPSSAAKLAALISCGQLALSSLAACWGRDALWHLLARSTVSLST